MNNQERASVRSAINYLRLSTSSGYEVRSALAALRQINTDAEPGRPADATGDSFEALIADMDPINFLGSAHAIRPLHARLRDLVAAEMLNEEQNTPEIVPGGKVNDLPVGSRVVGATRQGQAVVGATVHEVGTEKKIDLYHQYLVLHRAPERPIAVGDVLNTQAKIDRAVRVPGLVVRGRFNHLVAEADCSGTWLVTGRTRDNAQTLTSSNEYVVLYVPGKGDNQ